MKKTTSKKTTSMRVAAAMLALTLITSCFAGGTFAKYTTTGIAKDSARVAKFGVEIDAGTSTFLDKYETDDTTYTGAYSVQSDKENQKVVAPGTSGEFDLFTISGTPEVAVRIDVKMDDIESIMIKPILSFFKVTVEEWEVIEYEYNVGTFENVEVRRPKSETTKEEISDLSVRPDGGREWSVDKGDGWDSEIHTYKESYESNTGNAYYPIEWTLKKDGEAIANGTLADVKNYINENINGMEFAPNTDLSTISGSYTLEWKWDYEGGTDETRPAFDTYDTNLGNIAAGKYGIYLSKEENDKLENKEYNLTEAFALTITVTQID